MSSSAYYACATERFGAERMPSPGGRRHFHVNHLGTPRLITDDNGRRIGEHDYFPCRGRGHLPAAGDAARQRLQPEEPMKFTGHERDFTGGTSFENSNYVDYMHARSTVPQWGRFLSVDPVLGKPQQPQSWNRYAYVLNNPLRYTDPDGREHVNEPGFTKPLMEANWGDAPPIIQAAFYIQRALTMEAAAEFLGAWFTITATVTRYMGKEEANAARDTGEIPNVG